MRTLGVYGANLPTKKTVTVTPSDILIGGLIGQFERKFKKAFLCRNVVEAQEIFGQHVSSSFYGWDALKGFFDNIAGVDGKIYVKSHVGYTGSAYDAVTATANLVDGSAASTCRLDDAYMTELGFGVSGLRTGYTITNGARFTTASNGAGASGDAFLVVQSVAGIKVGDLIKIATGTPIYKKILTIDENTKRVTFTGTLGAIVPDATAVTVMGFRLRTWRKGITGQVTEVDTELGKIWCTMEAEVTDFYVNNVFASSKWLKATDLASGSALNLSFPIDVATVTYLISGADGTTPTTSVHWSINEAFFDNLPIRFLVNCETVDVSTQKSLETYCKARWDNPKVIFNIAQNQTKAQLIVIGQGYQRSDDVLGVIPSDWLAVTDPFTSSITALPRYVPNVGHVMGAWIRAIGNLGIHYIPAVFQNPIYGIVGLSGYGNTFSDTDRTDLATAGVNVIQYVAGVGYILRNFFTPSTTLEFMFANGILMRDYIKLSARDSLNYTQNEPNNFARIQESRMAILAFLYKLWESGSTGNVPTGETFGQAQNEDGSATTPDDHFFVQADVINNPQSSINAGERNLDCWIKFPSPAGSIRIGVGLWLG